MKIALNENERQLVAVLLVLGLLGLFYISGIKKEIREGEKIEAEISKYEESIKPFYEMAVLAKSVSIYDMDTETFIYKKNAEEVMPLASLAKVMSVVVALETLSEDHVFTINKEALSETGDNGLLVDERWGRDELLKYALVVSSNDAMHAIADEAGRVIDPAATDPRAVFVLRMNERSEELGFSKFDFSNESGLDLETEPVKNGAYGSGREMAKLFAYAVETYPEIFSATIQKTFDVASFDKAHVGENTNPFVEDINGLLASKTGFTNLSGGNLVVALKAPNNARIIVTVLGSTFDERFSDIKALSDVLNK